MPSRLFVLGTRRLGGDFALSEGDLAAHGVVFGATGSGKTGFLVVLMEEALVNGVPVVGLDVKGDLSSLGLPSRAARSGDSRLEAFAKSRVEVYTPGHPGGRPVSLLGLPGGGAEARSFAGDCAGFLLAAAGFALEKHQGLRRLLEEVVLYGLERGELGWEALPQMLLNPPFRQVGGVDVDSLVPGRRRREAAARLASFIGSSSFGRWLQGEALDFNRFAGEPGAYIFYLPHLTREEREAFVAFLLRRLYSWMLRQGASSGLRLLLVFDEVYGYLPPHPRTSPVKEPLLLVVKQGRAFGVSVFLSTQNPYDVDYRALSNAKLWVVGRLQTSNDRRRVLEGVREASSSSIDLESLEEVLASLKPREFLVYNAGSGSLEVIRTRDTYSELLGPLTLDQVSARAKPLPRHPPQAQATPSPEAGLLLLPPATEGVEEYFLRGRDLGEVVEELERRGFKTVRIVSAYYEPVLAVTGEVFLPGAPSPARVTRLVELARVGGGAVFLEESSLGLRSEELSTLQLETAPTPGFKFVPPGIPLAGRRALKLILDRFREELGRTSFRLYKCMETGELSNPAEDLASFSERQALAIAAGSRGARRESELRRIVSALKREYDAVERLERQLSELKVELLLDSIGKALSGRARYIPRRLASTMSRMRQIERKIREKQEKISLLREEAKKYLEEQPTRPTIREVYVKPSKVQVSAVALLWVPVVEVEAEENRGRNILRISTCNFYILKG